MKNSILFGAILLLVAVPFSSANAHGYGGSSSSSTVSIGISGGSGSFYYSRQHYNRSINYQRTVIRVGHGGYYGGNHSVYYGGYYGSGRGITSIGRKEDDT